MEQFSLWLDGVHLLGIAAGVLVAGAIVLGLTILLGRRLRGLGTRLRCGGCGGPGVSPSVRVP